MNDEYMNRCDVPVSTEKEKGEVNLLDYLLVLLKYKKMIFVIVSAAFLLTCAVMLLKPNIFTASTRILPPAERKLGLGGGMLSAIGDLGPLAGISLGSYSVDLYAGMLRSRTIADAIIDRFDLMKSYNQSYRTNTYATLEKLVSISIGKKDGIITVSVDDKDPERAAAIANAYIEELENLNVKFNLSNAGRERLFLEKRLELVKSDLNRTEDSLKEFQEKNKAIKIDAQATALIESVSRLRAELASKEVELGALLTYQAEQNPQVRELREVVQQLKMQLRQLEETPPGNRIVSDVFITTADMPDIGMRFARLMRDYKIQETLFELLTQQYEMAKISEAKNTLKIQVLDVAAVPDRKSKPNRKLAVIVATILAGFFSVVFAFIMEALNNLQEDDSRRLRQIKDNFKMNKYS
jgi:uncharacterized protein involved in exopolysaccharide biosynthesis